MGDYCTEVALLVDDLREFARDIQDTTDLDKIRSIPAAHDWRTQHENSTTPSAPTFTTVTGSRWVKGVEETVTGYPLRQGMTLSDSAFVTLLTEAGTVVGGVRVPLACLDGVRIDPLHSRASDEFLWKVAETDAFGAGARCLAELAMRDRNHAETAERDRHTRIERSRRDAARLLAA